jgi:hypothetical protein
LRLLPRILADEDELDREPSVTSDEATTQELGSEPAPHLSRWVAFVTALALVPRLGYLFIASDPENAGQGFTDAYHHWQIAYLTKEIGLTHGPRLWDLKGLEYFWGLVHPVLLNLLFFATGSVDIVLARLLSLAAGTLAVVLIFLLCHHYWGLHVALAASAFAALSPASVFNDDAGMVEPIAISLLLLGIWLTPKRGFWAGVAWGCAAMARVEAWLFAAGLVLAWIIGRRSAAQRLPLVAGWALVMAFYLKFLFDHTGNPIYPLYTNFQVVALGSTETNMALTPEQQLLRVPLGAIVVVSAAGLAWALWKRPPSFLLLTYGFGYWVFQAGTLGFTHYLAHTAEWMERRFEFPLDFAAILVAVLLFKYLARARVRLRPVAWAASAAALLGVQLFWIPIQHAYAATEPSYLDQVKVGRAIGQVYGRAEYRGGAIGVPADQPTLVYTMVRDGGVPGAQIMSEFYDPFYYLPRGYSYASHKDVVGPLLQCWLSSTHTRLLLIPPPSSSNASVPDYHAFIADNPQWFGDTGVQLDAGFALVAVQVPAPSASACSEAAKAAPH